MTGEEDWGLVQVFLSAGKEPRVYEVEMDLSVEAHLAEIRCTCPAFARATRSRACAHTRVVMHRAIWHGEYPIMVREQALGTPYDEVFDSPESYRRFIIENARVEVL